MVIVGHVFLLIGGLFMFLGALGLVRMPDVYNRIQVGTKAATLGSMSVLIGIGFEHPDWWGRLLLIGGFILFTNPVGSSTIARALYISGVRPWEKDGAAAVANGSKPQQAGSSAKGAGQ